MRRRSDARADAAAELEAAVDAKPNERMIAERKRLMDPNPEPDPWGLAPVSFNVCPDCGEPQFHAPGSGWTCRNGHGHGTPNGPEDKAAPTPSELLEVARREVSEGMQRREASRMAEARARGASAEGMRQARMVGEPDALSSVALDATGRTVTLTIGKQGFAPIRFHTFDVGPFSMTATLAPGDDLREVVAAMRATLEGLFRDEFDRAMKAHFANVKAAAEGADRAKMRRGEV